MPKRQEPCCDAYPAHLEGTQFPQVLKMIMKNYHYTIDKLAGEVEWSVDTIKRWRSGESHPSQQQVLALCRVLTHNMLEAYTLIQLAGYTVFDPEIRRALKQCECRWA